MNLSFKSSFKKIICLIFRPISGISRLDDQWIRRHGKESVFEADSAAQTAGEHISSYTRAKNMLGGRPRERRENRSQQGTTTLRNDAGGKHSVQTGRSGSFQF